MSTPIHSAPISHADMPALTAVSTLQPALGDARSSSSSSRSRSSSSLSHSHSRSNTQTPAHTARRRRFLSFKTVLGGQHTLKRSMSRPGMSRSPPGSPPGRTGALPDRGGFSSPTSPRSSFLGSFMRGRSRAASVTNAVAGAVRGRVGSPTVEAPNPMNAVQDGGDVQRSQSTPGISDIHIPAVDPEHRRTHRIRLVPVLESNRSFAFAPVVRDMGVMHVPPGVLPSIAAAAVTDPGPLVHGRPPPLLLKIGRFNDKTLAAPFGAAATTPTTAGAGTGGGAAGPSAGGEGSGAGVASTSAAAVLPNGGGGGDTTSPKAGYRSKVVSRAHAEIWCEPEGKFFIRDTASSSGTFLNHIRLSSPNVQSRPQLLKDGDVLQLGVDYQGGAEEMYRCVKMRVEIGREWQRGATAFNTQALNQLKALGGDSVSVVEKPSPSAPTGRKKVSVTDCCICLFSVTVCQSLFIAPCSHVFHYKCIRPLLNQHYPGFSCPLCRTFANLEEDVETEDAWEIASKRQSVISRRTSSHSLRNGSAVDVVAAVTTGAMPLGDSVASIDELLAPVVNEANDQESEETSSVSSRPGLGRHDTAVALSATHPTGVESPSVIEEEGSHATTNPMSIGNGPSPAPTENGISTAASMAQTPRNDVFLSTLAIPQMNGRVSPESVGGSGANSSRISSEIAEEPAAEAAAGEEDTFVLES